MKITKEKLKALIREELEATAGLDEFTLKGARSPRTPRGTGTSRPVDTTTPEPAVSDEPEAGPQGATQVQLVMKTIDDRVLGLPHIASALEVIKKQPKLVAQLQANVNKLLGVEVGDITRATAQTALAQKKFTEGALSKRRVRTNKRRK